MIVGDPQSFAIESFISRAYSRKSLRGRGFFLFHVRGLSYGVRNTESTFLANSFDAVSERLAQRGKHVTSFATEEPPGLIADAMRMTIYSPEVDSGTFLNMPGPDFANVLHDRHIIMAPDGDAAFDDGSFILQFDISDMVRIIAFKSGESYRHDPSTLRDVWLPTDGFYRILSDWRSAFEAEWNKMPKRDDVGE